MARPLVVLAGCLLSAACGGVIDGNTLDSGPTPSDAAHALDGGIFFDASVMDSSIVVRDSSVPFDTSVMSFDATMTFDVGIEDVTSMLCSSNTPFMPFPWEAPTPLRQGKCTPAQTMAYVTTLNSQNGPWTSGNAACDACLQTDVSAPTHGPILTQVMMGKETPVELNFGGCIADIDGMKAAGGCGNLLNNDNDCIDQECGMCPDFMMPSAGGPTEECTQQVNQAGGPCAADVPSSTCTAEENGDGGFQACVSSIQEILDLWCGP
jgi:hypothetical protein